MDKRHLADRIAEALWLRDLLNQEEFSAQILAEEVIFDTLTEIFPDEVSEADEDDDFDENEFEEGFQNSPFWPVTD